MKTKRLLSILIFMAFMIGLAFNSFAAEASVTMDNILNKRAGDSVTISGTNSLGDISIKVISPDKTILYINTTDAVNYSDTFTLLANAALGEYTVVTGQGTTVATRKFSVIPTIPATGDVTINDISDKRPGEKVTISGISTLGDISIKVISPDNTILYINTADTTNYSDTFTLPSNAVLGKYTVVVGKGAAVAIKTFNVVTGGSSGTDGTGDTGSTGGTGNQTPTTPNQTGSVDNGAITVNIKSDSNGLADVKLTDSDMAAAISGAKNDTVTIKIISDANAKNVSVSLPAQQISKAIEKNIEKVSIDAGFAKITIASDLIKENMQNGSDVLKLIINKVDTSKLPQAVQDIVKQGTVYDFTMMIGTRAISNFEKSGQISVSIKYDLKPEENPEKVIAYYINDSGNLEVVMNARYDANTGEITFAPKHFSKYAAIYSKATFSDIEKAAWAKTSIEALAARGIVAGVGGNKFNPDGNVTRAEFIQMLMKAFELNNSGATTTFDDVKEGAWYFNSIATAQKLGIVNGKPDGSFGVKDQISRQDMAVMLYRTAKIAKINLGSISVKDFTDKDKISAYAIEAVEAIQKAGIVSGVGNGSYAPMNKTTRAESAKIIYNLFSAVK